MIDWAGQFGDSYTTRNRKIPDRAPFWSRLDQYPIKNALEIGCNIGANMRAIEAVTSIDVTGIDVNESAIKRARAQGLMVEQADGLETDFNDDEFDLVFTVGVLIHLNTPEMIKMLFEMERIAKGYILMGEYRGDDIEVDYRGNRGALIKREYGGVIEALFPWGKKMWEHKDVDAFDTVTFWMYDFRDSPSKDGFYEISGESVSTALRETDVSASIAEITKESVS